MNNRFRKIKACTIIGIFLFSIMLAIAPNTMAKDTSDDQASELIGANSVVNVDWTNSDEGEIAIKPFTDTSRYSLTVTYQVNKMTLGGGIYSLLVGRNVPIKLELLYYPDWSNVDLFENTITATLPSTFGDPTEYKTTLFVSVDDDAPAFARDKIRLKVTIDDISIVSGIEKIFELGLRADYVPRLQLTPQTQQVKIGPMDISEVPIKVTNMGNGQTNAQFDVLNEPEGWQVVVTDNLVLDPGETGTIFLTATPPKGMGYHDDYATIKIRYSAPWSNDPTIGREYNESITIAFESRGISVIGIEIVLPIIILIIVAIFVVYLFIKKMQGK